MSLSAPLWAIVLVALVLVLAGTVKGTVGLGLPVFSISVLSSFMDPRFVLALMVVPVVASNVWQVLSTGGAYTAALRFWPLILAFSLATWLGAHLMASINTALLLGLLGVTVIAFCLSSFANPHLRLDRRHESWCGPVAGTAAGVLNGLSTVNGPPLVMYLVALGLKKDEFVGSYGLIAVCGSIPLAVSYLAVGVLGPRELIWSTLALVPVFIGLVLGARLRRCIDPDLFRRVLLVILAVLGVNLIRRALF